MPEAGGQNKLDITLTKYEVQGGSLHCVRYAVKTSEALGLEGNNPRFIETILFIGVFFKFA